MGCYNSIVIDAPADKVWNVVKNFHDLSWSKNVISKVDKIGNKAADEIGARRILNDAFHETLLSFDDAGKSLSYSIDDGPAVVSKDNVTGYVGELTVFPVSEDGTTFVLWTSHWVSAKEGGIEEFCNPIYYGLLQDLKEYFSS